MSSTRERGQQQQQPSCNNFARAILRGFSRALARTRNQSQTPSSELQYPQPLILPNEWTFLPCFEQQYGSSHPFFYACSFMEALKLAEDEKKLMFMYLHSPEHPFTPSFCAETLRSDLVLQFMDENFVSWGALADRGEGLQMAATLRPATFPFCAVIAPAPGNNITVLQQIEGPIGPAELVEMLQRTMEEKGMAFGNRKAEEEERRRAKMIEDEKIRANRQLRAEQDAAYLAALQIDQEKERMKNERSKKIPLEDHEKTRQSFTKKQPQKPYQASTITHSKNNIISPNQGRDPQTTQILIRFPNGERREQSFSCSDKIQGVYRYIDSLGQPGIGANYRLVSSFPRKVFGVDHMGMSLKDAGLHPRASLFLELV